MKSYKELRDFFVEVEKDKNLRRLFLEKYYRSEREVEDFFKEKGYFFSFKEIEGVLFYSAIKREFTKNDLENELIL